MQNSGTEVRLRAYRPADLEALCRIDQICFAPEISYALEELQDFVTTPGARTWVAESGGSIAGFILGELEQDEAVHVITIDVLPEFRRLGVGSLLMDALEAWAAGLCKIAVLETAEDNLAAQSFYRKRGYRKLDVVKNYYPDGKAAWVMGKRLS